MSNDKGSFLSHGGKRLVPASNSIFTTCPTCAGTSMVYQKEGDSELQCLTCWGNTPDSGSRPVTVYTLTIRDDDDPDTRAVLTVDTPGKLRKVYRVDYFLSAHSDTETGARNVWNASTQAGREAHDMQYKLREEPAS